ncbi:MAG: hypothetical protein IJS50_00680 [Desulfovibrio sp.]|nr:hypothetical protein [Desulfovibrio sp.]
MTMTTKRSNQRLNKELTKLPHPEGTIVARYPSGALVVREIIPRSERKSHNGSSR